MVVDYKRWPMLAMFAPNYNCGSLPRFAKQDENKRGVYNSLALEAFIYCINERGLYGFKNKPPIFSGTFVESANASRKAFASVKLNEYFKENYEPRCLCYKGARAITVLLLPHPQSNSMQVAYFADDYMLALFFLDLDMIQCDVAFISNAFSGGAEDVINNIINEFAILLFFEKYASVETETAKSGKVVNSAKLKDKIKSTLPFDVDVRDSRWYTKVCRDEDYKVSGHFRLQPCGEGRTSRKLVFINEFVKHGYHRQAKIERV